jgi:hypothetical protein
MRRVASNVARSVWIGVVLIGAAAARAQAPEPEAAPAVDPETVAIAQRAGDWLRERERFSFTAETAWEVVQPDGALLEFGATRRYLVQRPDRVRVDVAQRDGDRRLVVFDGDRLVLADLDEDVYAQLDTREHRTTDEAIDLLRDVLDVPMPLAELLRSDPRPDLVGALVEAYRVGEARLDGVACDHLFLRNPDADLQLWIAQGAEPLLRRVVIRYRDEPGAPSFAADLDWSFDAKPAANAFRFEPGPTAERIRFAVPVAPPEAAGAEGPEETN